MSLSERTPRNRFDHTQAVARVPPSLRHAQLSVLPSGGDPKDARDAMMPALLCQTGETHQIVCFPPFRGKFREPTASPVVVGPPLSAVNTMMMLSIISFAVSAAVTLPTP